MSGHFIKLSKVHGELKRSTKRKNLGLTISTKEVVFQLPHVNYHIFMQDIVSIAPFQHDTNEALRMVHHGVDCNEIIRQKTHTLPNYKIFAFKVMVHNRTGKHMISPLDLIMPISRDMIEEMILYSELKPVY